MTKTEWFWATFRVVNGTLSVISFSLAFLVAVNFFMVM